MWKATFIGPVLTEWVFYSIFKSITCNLFLNQFLCYLKVCTSKIWPFTFCALMGPARGCFCLCSFGSGSLSVDFSESTGPTSLSLPLEAGAPNWIVSIPSSTPPSCPGFVPYLKGKHLTCFKRLSNQYIATGSKKSTKYIQLNTTAKALFVTATDLQEE